MKAVAFSYQAPGSLADALARLGAGSDIAKTMGGGQSLGPMLNLRLTRPDTVVDIAQLPELREVSVTSDYVRIGACVTHAQIEDGVFEPLRGTMLQAVAGGIAYRAIRNRGTVGGSLAHADPAADWVVTMTALGAQVEIASAAETRMVPMDAFMIGAYTTVLEDGELIAAVRIPGKCRHPLGLPETVPQDRGVCRGKLCRLFRCQPPFRTYRAGRARRSAGGPARVDPRGRGARRRRPDRAGRGPGHRQRRARQGCHRPQAVPSPW
ncbi:FAD binding domain-containing protein [Cupriavidus basilensis]